MILDSNQIQEIIPHRYPFLLVDKVLEMSLDTNEIIALKNVSANEMQFMGHFPNYHLMPGVLIVEALAQTGAILLLSKDEYKNKLAMFAGIDKVRFKGEVRPGDTLILKASLIKLKGFIGIAQVEALVDEKVVVSGEIKFAIKL